MAFRQASGKDEGELTSVDLLNITQLDVARPDFTGFLGWPWLTNPNTLNLSGDAEALGFLTNLTQLTSLRLEQPAPSELGWLMILTNLTELDVSGVTISNLSFVSPMTSLKSLGVRETRVTDLAPLSGLTNLGQVRCQHNLVTNILALYGLPTLSAVDVRYNLLDTAPGSLAWAVVNSLDARGVDVDYLPQRAAPVVRIASDWNVGGDRSSFLTFTIVENGEVAYGLAGVGSRSSNPGLLPDANQGLAVDTNSSSVEWVLAVTPLAGQSGSTVITVTATNDVGLSSSTSLVFTVSIPLPLDDHFPGMTDLSWQVGGDLGWFGQTAISAGGFPAAQTGGITHGQDSLLESTLIGPGTLRFWWKISSEVDYDWLMFESSNVTNRISGEVDWQEREIPIARARRQCAGATPRT